MHVKPRHWAALLALVVLWGSSYLMIEIALQVWQPAEIAGLRISTGAVVLVLAALAGRRALPRDLRSWAWFLVIAVIGNAMPFYLISWGQQGVESGLAGILAATTPLFTLLLAHWALEDERIRPRQLVAFAAGFGGVVVLLGPGSLAALGGSGSGIRLISQLAVLGGALCYALATVGARFIPPGHPVTISAGVMVLAGLVMGPASASGLTVLADVPPVALAAMAFLGVLGTGLASIIYFYLVAETGARFTSQLNYLVPVWAVALGRLILAEQIPLSAWLALTLILCGLYLMRDAAPTRQAKAP